MVKRDFSVSIEIMMTFYLTKLMIQNDCLVFVLSESIIQRELTTKFWERERESENDDKCLKYSNETAMISSSIRTVWSFRQGHSLDHCPSVSSPLLTTIRPVRLFNQLISNLSNFSALYQRLDQYAIIKYPLTTESAMKKIEDHNTLVFITHIRANKPQIRDAVKKLYDVNVAKINTLIR